jgi:hypothetical protein
VDAAWYEGILDVAGLDARGQPDQFRQFRAVRCVVALEDVIDQLVASFDGDTARTRGTHTKESP